MALQPGAWLLALSALASERGVAPALADDSLPVHLELAAPSRCSSLRDLLEAIQRRNARVRLAADSEAGLSLSVSVREEASGASGELTLRTAEGEASTRHVTGPSCEAVVDALALTAALSLQSYDFTPPPAPPVAPVAEPAPAPPAVSPPVDRSAPRARLLAELGAQASLGQMVSPHLQAGGGVLGRLRIERGVVSPSFTLALTHSQNELFESSRHAGVYLTGVALSVCPISLRPARSVRLEPCASASAAQLRAAGRDLPEASTVKRSWWAAGAVGRIAVSPWSGFSLEVEAGALLPLVERRFVVEPSGRSLGTTPAIAPFVTAGLAHAL